MTTQLLPTNELRVAIQKKGVTVRAFAQHFALSVRTLERRFGVQFRMSPKAWIMRERMSLALPLLAQGLSNKQVAASLNYTCESNFCRDFKNRFGRAPQEFVRNPGPDLLLSRSDKELSRSDKCPALPGPGASRILPPWTETPCIKLPLR